VKAGFPDSPALCYKTMSVDRSQSTQADSVVSASLDGLAGRA
jgi:hypothetical protein